MDVTQENFEEAAGQLQELLKTCKFVAFDEEMTGAQRDALTFAPKGPPMGAVFACCAQLTAPPGLSCP